MTREMRILGLIATVASLVGCESSILGVLERHDGPCYSKYPLSQVEERGLVCVDPPRRTYETPVPFAVTGLITDQGVGVDSAWVRLAPRGDSAQGASFEFTGAVSNTTCDDLSVVITHPDGREANVRLGCGRYGVGYDFDDETLSMRLQGFVAKDSSTTAIVGAEVALNHPIYGADWIKMVTDGNGQFDFRAFVGISSCEGLELRISAPTDKPSLLETKTRTFEGCEGEFWVLYEAM